MTFYRFVLERANAATHRLAGADDDGGDPAHGTRSADRCKVDVASVSRV